MTLITLMIVASGFIFDIKELFYVGMGIAGANLVYITTNKNQ